MSIEIFKGRKARYNKLILKALYEKGYLSAWKIAREIVKNDPEKLKRNWYHATQKVYSVLVRKAGRLKELLDKEFIEETDQGYCLTTNKGLCTALTLYENVREPAIDMFSRTYVIFPELKETMELISRLHPDAIVEQYKAMLRTTKELLDQGWNLDKVSNMQFNRIFSEQLNELLRQEFKEKRESGKKWEPNPEVQESMWKFLDKLRKIYVEEVKKIDKEFDSLEESMRKPRQEKRENKP